ncbi:hypothetical protein GMDG_02157 [Pseudogymnoascus destructans 20631-21]|uniref:Uncharacterized protein n=1 Tax=Pseudogymnoascus destructans (strain ATCC MYA-4855 / 20631-21) TaxID=658429 RepID=L8G057_PSED2|nr:hypothetical protein GMDG_02157 [Pseudogymnoascus destructans 20631-21]
MAMTTANDDNGALVCGGKSANNGCELISSPSLSVLGNRHVLSITDNLVLHSNVRIDVASGGTTDLWGHGSLDLLAANEASNVVDLSIASYLDHLRANLLHKRESVTDSNTSEEETYLEVAIVRVHLPSRADWANPLKSIGSTSGSSGVGIALVGKTDDPLWSTDDLHRR